VKAGVNVHALASQCTVLQSAFFLSCQRFHDYNCLQCPQQRVRDHTSAQTSTQESLAVGRCLLLTLSGRALATLGQHSPESGRSSSFETAPVSKGWDAHSRGGHVDSTWATPLR